MKRNKNKAKNIYEHPIIVLLIAGIFITSLGLMLLSDTKGWMFPYGLCLLNTIFSAGWIIVYGIPILWHSYKRS
jgi:hypothetical protein